MSNGMLAGGLQQFRTLQLLEPVPIELQVESPIVPGQPIVFSWTAQTIFQQGVDLGHVTVSLYLVDEFENIDTGGELYSYTIGSDLSLTSVPYTSPPHAAHPIGDIANRVYQFGTHTLRLVLSGTGQFGGPYESYDALLVVQGEPIDFSWWEWTVPSLRKVQWKVDKPAVQGNLVNKSKYSTITCTATIFEQNLTDGDGTWKEIGSDQPAAPAGPLQSAAISYGRIDFSKNWAWFISGIWVPNGKPIDRLYSYQTRLDITDNFQNGYSPAVESLPVYIDFRVSTTKIAALSSAAGLMAGAAVMFVAGAATICFGGGALIGIASGMVAAAAISGKIADDPPTPDEHYSDSVEGPGLAVPDAAAKLHDLKPVVDLLASVFSILNDVDAIGSIQGKIQGAQQAKDADAERFQESELHHRLSSLQAEAARLDGLAPLAGTFLAAHERATPAALRGALFRWTTDRAFHNSIRQQWISSQGNSEGFDVLDRFVRLPNVGDRIADSSLVYLGIAKAARSLAATVAQSSSVSSNEHRTVPKRSRAGRSPRTQRNKSK